MKVLELLEKVRLETEAARTLQENAAQEGRDLTEEEAGAFDKHLREAKKCEKLAGRLKTLEDQESRLTTPSELHVPIETATGSPIQISGAKMYQAGTLRAFKGPKAQDNAYKCGRFLAATLFDHALSRQWCRDHGVEIRKDTDIDSRAMSEGINTAGGFIVPDEFENSIIDLREEYGNARRNCRIKVMGSDHTNEPKKTGRLTAHPIGEGGAFTESQQEWGNVELTAKKWGVLVKISSEIAEDALINLASDLSEDCALAFATAEDEACIDGDGTGTYHGIVGIRTKMIIPAYVGSLVEAAGTGDEWDEIDAADLTNVMAALPAYARRGAKWHCSPLAKVAVFDRLTSAGAGNTIITLEKGAAPVPRYMGYPIEEWPAMPTVDQPATTLNDVVMLMFGNMNMSSKMGVRRGITVKRLVELYAANDQIGIIASERMTINHHTIGGAAGVRGPIVGLLGTS